MNWPHLRRNHEITEQEIGRAYSVPKLQAAAPQNGSGRNHMCWVWGKIQPSIWHTAVDKESLTRI